MYSHGFTSNPPPPQTHSHPFHLLCLGGVKDILSYCYSPDIQVGIPLSSLVDKVLESEAKELLPKITEIVEKLRETKTNQSSSTPEALSSSQFSRQTTEKSVQEIMPKPKATDFGSLPLPIDIPGLSSSVSGNTVAKKEPTEGKAPTKVKSKISDNGSVKETKTKGKPNQVKLSTVKESVKEKESVIEKDIATEDGTKERDKHKSTPKQKKTKDEAKDKDKGVSAHREKSQDAKQGVVEKLDKEPHPSKSDNKVGKGVIPVTQQEQPSMIKKDPTMTKADSAESEVQSESKKVLPQRRRSARIASLSESVEDTKEDKDSDEHCGVKEQSSEREMVDRAVSEGTVNVKGVDKRKRKQQRKSGVQKKRQRLLSSSSDEELEQISSEEESDQGSANEVRKNTTKGKSKLADYRAPTVKRSRKRTLQQVINEDKSLPIPKKSRKLSKVTTDNAVQDLPPSSEPVKIVEDTVQKPHRRKSSQPQRLPQRASKSPPSVVVTRYNRQIKPNRRYLENSGEADEVGSEPEDNTGEEKRTAQDQRDAAYSDIETYSEGSSQES